jgi:hypothetical protein
MLEWNPRLVLILVALASLASVLSLLHLGIVTGVVNNSW